ncbi:hypothetical protein BDF19DRAFT_117440 [Syncephalis fuscata]|nr:hypothetical protein BDF19DRAFT_117440 [Syncephalis fuscata]
MLPAGDDQDGLPVMAQYNATPSLNKAYPNYGIHGTAIVITSASLLATCGLLFYISMRRLYKTPSQRLILYLSIIDIAVNLTHFIGKYTIKR